MALQRLMSNPGPRELAQEDLEGRLQKLREQRERVKAVMDYMVRRMEMAKSHATTVKNASEYFCHFMTASVTMDRMLTKMLHAQFLLEADGFGVDPDYLRAPMAITYSFQDSDWNYTESALDTSGLSTLPSISRPSSVTSLNLSVCDEMLGPGPALGPPQQSESHAVALSPGLAPARALAYTSPVAPSAVEVPHGVPYPVPASPLACSLQPALTGGPGTQAGLATSPAAYGDHEPQQQFMASPAGAGCGSLPELSASSTPGCESPKAQFVAGSGAMPEPPTPGYFISGAKGRGPGALPNASSPVAQLTPKPKQTAMQTGSGPASCTGPSSELNLPPATAHMGLMGPSTDRADVKHVEKMPSCGATPRAKVPVRGAVPAAEGVAPPPVLSATTMLHKSAKGAVKEDVRDRGDVCSVLGEADQGNNNYGQGQGKPGGSKASVSVPPGFTALHRQPERIVTGVNTLPDGSSSSPQATLESVMAGSVKSLSPGSHKYFSVPPADTSVIGSTQKVVLSFYKNPSEFWLQLESSGEVLDSLQNDLGAYYKSNAAHEEFEAKVGMHCVAHYTVDDHWYRAQITELQPDMAKVVYLDFGNSDHVPLTHLCLLAEEFTSLPVQAFECSIKGVFGPGSSRLWPISTVGQFRSMVQKDEIQLEAVFYLRDSITGRFIVDVLGKTGNEPAVNLSQEFLDFCARVALEPSKAATCGIDGAAQQSLAVGAPATTTERHGPAPSAPAIRIGAEACPDSAVSKPTSASAEAFLEGASVHVPGPPATTILATGPPPASTPPTTELLVAPPLVTPAVVPKAAMVAAARSPAGPSVRPPAGVPPARPPAGVPLAGVPPAKPPAGVPPARAPAGVPPAGVPPAGVPPARPPTGVPPPARPPAGVPPPARPPAGEPPAGVPPAGVRPAGVPPTGVPLPARPPAGVPPPARPPAGVPPPARPPAGVPPPARPPAGVPPPARPLAGVPPAQGAVARRAPPPGLVTIHALPPPPATVPHPSPGAAHLPAIPPAVLPDGRNFTFILSVVVSPADFYGQILTQNGTPTMLEDLQQQLNQKGSTSSPPPSELVSKGSFWICSYERDSNWYRAQVLDLGNTPNGWRARVLYVDYGNRAVVKLENLRPLPENLARPPACAHRMALAMLSPPQGNKWNARAADAFVSETGFKTVLFAEKKGQRQDGLETVTDVVVWNKNGDVPVNVNRLLVTKKFAQLNK